MKILLLVFLLAVLASCQDDDSDNLILLHIAIGNQSGQIDPIDIQVLINDNELIKQEFNTLDFHNWKIFEFKTPKGDYTLKVNSEKARSTNSIQLTLDKEKWILIEHYSPRAVSNPDNNFFIRILNEPFAFE